MRGIGVRAAEPFIDAREFLLARRDEYADAYREFRWPVLDRFNWALDWFDAYASGNDRPALWLVADDAPDVRLSFAELSARSNRVANALRRRGARRGDRLLLMLPNVAPLWETLLGAMKLGVVLVPTTTQLSQAELADRMDRGEVRHVVTDAEGAAKLRDVPGRYTRLVTDAEPAGWAPFAAADAESDSFTPDGSTRATDPLLLYFTSGTTARPKLVLHSHQSYPVGTCPRCTGSVCAKATSTGTSARPAGPSMPGAARSPPGTRARPSSAGTMPASILAARSRRSSGAGSPRSARRRPSGACWWARTWRHIPWRCAKSWGRASHSIPR